jgi:ribonuclease R
MEKLYLRLRQHCIKRGSLDFDLPEPEIIMAMEEGRVDTIVKAKRTRAHMMIEEFMIAANEAVARYITKHDVPTVYRIHEAPHRENLTELQEKLHNLGYALKIPKKKIEPKILADIIRRAQGKPENRMINTLLLRSLAKAIYSTDNLGHFGLASKCYTHFTSPIRRYPDLIVHRILSSLLPRGKTTSEGAQAPSEQHERKGATRAPTIDLRRLSRMSEHCSLRERLAMQSEWAVRDLIQVVFMEAHVGKSFAGIISNVTRFGFFVELTKYFVEGLVHMRNLTDDYYHYIEASHSLMGKRTKKHYRIGDSIWVKVTRTDIEKRWIDFEMITSPDLKPLMQQRLSIDPSDTP